MSHETFSDSSFDMITDPAVVARLTARAAEFGFNVANKSANSFEDTALALSRLAILPSPPHDNLTEDFESFVQSPWLTTPRVSVKAAAWDGGELITVALDDLLGTDAALSRKKIRKHIEAIGQGLTPPRYYALVVAQNGKNVIVDGHHRLMAQWLMGQTTAPVWILRIN